MWIILKEMGVPSQLVVLLKNMYANQKAAVKTEFRERRKSSTSGKVCDRVASCLLCYSTLLYTEKIMIYALDNWEEGITTGGRVVTNLRYADDTTVIAGTKEDLI